jgi:hypothetical protein
VGNAQTLIPRISIGAPLFGPQWSLRRLLAGGGDCLRGFGARSFIGLTEDPPDRKTAGPGHRHHGNVVAPIVIRALRAYQTATPSALSAVIHAKTF